MKTSGNRRITASPRFVLVSAILAATIVSCKKDVTSPSAGTKLAFVVQPTSASVDSSIIPAITVYIEDADGNLVTNSTVQVSLTLNATDGANLLGSAAVDAAGGIATYPYLAVSRPGTGYTLTASAAPLASATSTSFSITQITTGTFTQINAGGSATCGVANGLGYCWGNNSNGQLGNASTSNSTIPGRVAGGLAFQSTSVGSLAFFACGLTTAGAAYCWGYNDYGQLGSGNYTNTTSPVPVTGNLTFTSITAGASGHACALTSTGAAYCWGYNGSGQLGVSAIPYTSTPVAVSGGLSFANISAGENGQTCGVTTGGAGYCWGFNGDGELGNGTTTSETTPTPVSGGLAFRNISVGFSSACGVTTAGAVYCWGLNTYGELGNGTTTSSSTPVAISGAHTFTTVSVGDEFACGIATGGSVYCWGYGAQGALGSGVATNSATPVALYGGLSYASISAGYSTACAVTTGGAGFCWGNNSSGQLGNASTSATIIPVLVATPP